MQMETTQIVGADKAAGREEGLLYGAVIFIIVVARIVCYRRSGPRKTYGCRWREAR